MTHNSFFTSDTHFGHANILTFKRDDGSPLRPFQSIGEHDEILIQNWNALIKPHDKVYHLGDVVINRRNLPILTRPDPRYICVSVEHTGWAPVALESITAWMNR